MKIKCISFSKYNTELKSYVFSKLDLFEFLFTQIILKENIDKNKKVIDSLKAIDINEDLFYLFNNVFYKFKDNGVIECLKDDIYDLTFNDIKINDLFKERLLKGDFANYDNKINKEFIYDYLNNKLVVSNTLFNESNLACFRVSNNKNEIERLVNKFNRALFNNEDSLYLIDNVEVDPYYFEIELEYKNGKLTYLKDNKEMVYKELNYNSLILNDTNLSGEYLSSNIYFDVIYGKLNMKDNAKYIFVNDENNEGKVDNNVIYVNYKFDEGEFIDLVNKERYKVGVLLLEDTSKISTYLKEKESKVSEFKLYLIKNKDKFKINIDEIVNMF